MTPKVFWNRVKKLLKDHKMTQKEFAEYINIPLSTFQGMIHYERLPVLDLALNIAKVLGVTVEYLANGNDREMVNKRLKTLADRQSVSVISKLSFQIIKETEKIRNEDQKRLKNKLAG